MTKINYKSDFDFILRLKDCADPKKTVPFPDGNFDARFWTSNKANAYTASYRDGVYTNCFRTEDGGMHFVFDDHRMGKGTLHWEPHFELPNDIYPDNMQDLYRKAALDIELVDGDGDCPTTAELEAMLPYIKGEPFTFEDFTPEQIAELQRPATEAASSVLKLETTVETAEKKRIADEQSRQTAEQERVGAEETRVSNESIRQSNEQKREKAEADRQKAEEERAEEFADWEFEIDSKADRSELSNVLAEEPLTPDNFPGIDTYTREQLKMDLFIDMFNSRCKVANNSYEFGGYFPDRAPDPTHPFLLNKIWLSYDEALEVMRVPDIRLSQGVNSYTSYRTARTLFPLIGGSATYIFGLCAYSYKLEIVRIVNHSIAYGGDNPDTTVMNIRDTSEAFTYCTSLLEVQGILHVQNNDAQRVHFYNGLIRCDNLHTLWLNGVCLNIPSFRWLKSIKCECIQYLIENAANTDAITITVHPDVFAKLTDETNTDWHPLLALAAEKNISFGTV